MLRLTHVVVLVALGSAVVAGPTVRRDEVTNVVTVPEGEGTAAKPVPVESPSTVPKVDPAVPVKLPVAADEQPDEPTTAKAPKDEQPNAPEVGTTSTETATTTTDTATSTTEVATSSVASTTSGVPTAPTAPTAKPPRKTITFDQRQEGKYNIRADLENFVIVVVPSGSSSGASLLDFLTRSAQKKDGYHHHHHHHQTRKHNSSNGKRKNTKAQYAGAPKKKVPQGVVTPEVIVLDESNQRSGQLAVEEFIEGRTPYKVDLSSSARSVDEEELSEPHRQQQQQQQSGASFRFSVEPSATVEARSSGRVRFPQGASGNYARSSSDGTGRALRRAADESGFANTNTLVEAAGSSAATNHNHHNHLHLPGDGTDHQQQQQLQQLQQQHLPTLADPSLLLRPSRRSANGGREDDADAHHTGAEGSHAGLANHSHLPSSFDSLEYAPLRPDVDMTQLQLQPDGADRYDDLAEQRRRPDSAVDLGEWDDELRLLGAQEQCGPDRKRDSYGVCQFVRP